MYPTLVKPTQFALLPLALALVSAIAQAPATPYDPLKTFAPLTLANVARKLTELSRYTLIAKAFWDEGVALGTGIAHPAVCLAALTVCLGIPRGRRRQPVVIPSLVTLLALIAGYFLTYVITPLDLAWHVAGAALPADLAQSRVFVPGSLAAGRRHRDRDRAKAKAWAPSRQKDQENARGLSARDSAETAG